MDYLQVCCFCNLIDNFLQHFIELSNIKKCNTFGGNVFVLEEYGNILVVSNTFTKGDCKISFLIGLFKYTESFFHDFI